MVCMKWTPRLESAFKRLMDTVPMATTTSPEDLATLTKVDALLHGKDNDEKTTSPTSEMEPVPCVDMDLIQRVSKLLLKHRSTDGDDSHQEDYIHDMIKGSSVYIPKPPPKERSPELERIMDEVKAKIAEKEYQRMVANVDPYSSQYPNNSSLGANLSQDLKDVRAHTLGIINVLYTGAAVFTAAFLISAHFVQDLGMRVLLSFFSFVFIVACEAYLYTRHTSIANELNPGLKKKKRTIKSESKDTVTTTTSFSKVKLD